MTRLPSLGPRGEGWLAAQLALILFVGNAPSLDGPPAWTGSAAAISAVVGTGFVAIGVCVAILAARQLSASSALTALPRPRDDARLVETGLYQYVRHPIYSGIELAAIGWSLAWASSLALVGAAALFVVLAMKATREEAWLAARHPAYAAYLARTKRLIPGLY